MLGKLATAISGKAVAFTAAAVVGVTGVGLGTWYLVRDPQVTVVQRSSSVQVAARGEQSAVASCLAHETALNGGFALGGRAFATRSMFVGSAAWLVSAYNPGDEPATLTAYALCVNAKVEFEGGDTFGRKAHAYRDRADKISPGFADMSMAGPFASLPRNGLAMDGCLGGFTAIGMEFQADRSVSGRPVRPVPLEDSWPDASTGWGVQLNSGTALSHELVPLQPDNQHRYTRILERDQRPEVNYAVSVRPICVKLSSVSAVASEIQVGAGASVSTALRCPKKQHVVGGAYAFPAPLSGTVDRFLHDGWVYASASAPAGGEPSGRPVTAWHLTGVNQENNGRMFDNTVWLDRVDDSASLLYFGDSGGDGGDVVLKPFPVPAYEVLQAKVICAKIDATPIDPAKSAKPPVVARPDLVPAIDVPSPLPSALPSPSPTDKPSPSPSPSRLPSTSPSRSPSATPAQPPAVTVAQPQAGDQLCYGPHDFAAIAKTRPGGTAITGAQYTTWELITASGQRSTLGSGPSGTFDISPNAVPQPGMATIAFAAVDPGNGLKTTVKVEVWIQNC